MVTLYKSNAVFPLVNSI